MEAPKKCTPVASREPKVIRMPTYTVRFATLQAEKTFKRILKEQRRIARINKGGNLSISKLPSSVETRLDNSTKKTSSGVKRKSPSKISGTPIKKLCRVVVGKKIEDPFIASLGPIPPENSDLFAKMSFVFCHAKDDHQCKSISYNRKVYERASKVKPFYCEERLALQIKFGGGKVYENLNLVPIEERATTKLVTNAPSLHPQRILCEKAGIKAYSHRWIIKCCQQNKPLDPSPDEIPDVDRKNCICKMCRRSLRTRI